MINYIRVIVLPTESGRGGRLLFSFPYMKTSFFLKGSRLSPVLPSGAEPGREQAWKRGIMTVVRYGYGDTVEVEMRSVCGKLLTVVAK